MSVLWLIIVFYCSGVVGSLVAIVLIEMEHAAKGREVMPWRVVRDAALLWPRLIWRGLTR